MKATGRRCQIATELVEGMADFGHGTVRLSVIIIDDHRHAAGRRSPSAISS